jgi:cytochrome b561
MHQPDTPRPGSYDKVAATLHWLIGFALLGQIAFGFLLDEIAPRGTPSRASVINLHKSFGIVLGVAILVRLAWRLAHRPPTWPLVLPDWQRRAAQAMHLTLYACMVVMPASGYIASNFSKHGVRLFGQTLKAWGPDLPPVYDALTGLHSVTGWLLAILVGIHVLAALQHAFVARDGVFARMWPWAARAPASDGDSASVSRAPRAGQVD